MTNRSNTTTDAIHRRNVGLVVPFKHANDPTIFEINKGRDGQPELEFRISTPKMGPADSCYITVYGDDIEAAKALLCIGALVGVDGAYKHQLNNNGSHTHRLKANRGVSITPTAQKLLSLIDERIGLAKSSGNGKPAQMTISADSVHEDYEF